MIETLLAGIKASTQLSEGLTTQLESVKGFEKKEAEHAKEETRVEARANFWLGVLLIFYICAFLSLYSKLEGTDGWTILPWITAIFLTSSPLIWAVRLLNRAKTRHIALRENAYANRLLTLMVFYKPRDKHAAELVKKFFDRHDRRGTAQLVIALESGQKPDEGGGTVEKVVDTVKDGVKDAAE